MKSEHEIYLNFRKANNLVSELRSIARDTRRMASGEFQGALNQADRAWNGENSEEFLRKGLKIKSNLQTMADDVDKIANTIEQIADNTYRAEMRAVRIAKEKKRK